MLITNQPRKQESLRHNNMKTLHKPALLTALAAVLSFALTASQAKELPPMLNLPQTGENPTSINYAQLPVLRGQHAVVSFGEPSSPYRLHNYLTFFDGKYWCMWSNGPVIEDHARQIVCYATSSDGLHWNAAQQIMPRSTSKGFRYIARGFWVRDGKLLALASYDQAYLNFVVTQRVHYFGKSLQLMAWEWQSETAQWKPLGTMFKDAINNFPPQLLPNGEWAMLRRNHKKQISLLVGGTDSPLDWTAMPLATSQTKGRFRAEEPDWWTLPDNRLLGLFRDNCGSKRFYRAVSEDNGRTWTTPEKTNFPDATSKFFCLRTSHGYYVLISNANPTGRNPLCLSTSEDGITFTRMGRLDIPEKVTPPPSKIKYIKPIFSSYQYPHAIEHDGHLLIAYSRAKRTIEVVKVPLSELDALRQAK